MSIDSIRSRHSLFWLVLVLGLSIAAIMGVKRYLALRHEAELQAAIRQLRSEFFAEDYEGAALEGEKLIKQFAASSELKAWYLSCLARSDERAEARKLATEVVQSHPNDPWSWFTLASVLNVENSQDSQAQALAASEKALALMPRHPDFLWLRAETLFFQGRAEEVPAFVDRHRTDLQSPAELLVVKARALEYLGTRVRPDQSKVAAAYAALEEARRIDPQNFEAYNLAGVYLTHEGLPADAIPLLERAVRLQPSSLSGHWNYWRAFNALAPTQKSAREAAVRVDVDSMLERGGSRPKTLSFIAFQYGEMGELSKQRMIGDRVLTGC